MSAMPFFNLTDEAEFNSAHHVENILSTYPEADFTVACWEPGQKSSDHCHPEAIETYFCFSGGGVMKVDDQEVAIIPGAFIVHPLGEFHQYVNGPERTLLFRVRSGPDKRAVNR